VRSLEIRAKRACVRRDEAEHWRPVTSPTVPRRRLGQELIRIRRAAGLTGEQVAAAMEWSSTSKLYKIEGGRQGIQVKELRELLGRYGVTDAATVEALSTLARQGKQRAWWTQHVEAMPDSYATYLGLESGASELRVYEPNVIHGLLQTESYARAFFQTVAKHAPKPAAALAQAEGKIKIRLERQALLTRETPLSLWIVQDEASLRRIIGGPDVMAEQYDRLIEVSRLPSVKLQVLPLRDSANPAPPTNFAIIEFDPESDLDIVYIELLIGSIFVEGKDVRRYNVQFDNLRAAALSPSQSRRLIEDLARGVGRADTGRDVA